MAFVQNIIAPIIAKYNNIWELTWQVTDLQHQLVQLYWALAQERFL
jgi:hypothetical protein